MIHVPIRRHLLAALMLLVPCLGAAALHAQEAAGADKLGAGFFEREVRPVLEKRCLGCHGVGTTLGKLDLRSREAALKGGTRGASLVPGKSADSLLYHLVTGERTPLMPPGGKLPAAEIAVLKQWIDGGAPWDGEAVKTAAEQVWWSFRPLSIPVVPKLNSPWVKNPIDAFVLAKLKANGLSPSPPATRPALIRRAYLDLIGIPPTPEEVDAFVADTAPDAYEKVVDRLLASPHYGERWGRHWLDVARFSESSGFEGDKDRPLAWRYRDYVIQSFNEDKPYPEFIREQLAGDEVKPGDPAALVATGYLGLGQEDFAMVKLPQTRADEVDDLVSTTGSAVLGLTIGCARCHDHKYDPVSQADYFRLYAVFAPTERREVEIPTPEEKRAADARNAELDRELAPLKAQAEPLRAKGAEAAKAAGHANPNDEQILAALPEAERAELTRLNASIKEIDGKRPQLPKAMTVTDAKREFEPVKLHVRGDANVLGPVVEPGFLHSLPDGKTVIGPEAATATTTGRRRALAEWLASPKNPLTYRVWMSRVWRHHFGRGIVESPSNFGINGDLPTHPELLDWLARKFISGGYRLKPIHRLIMLSSTYRQGTKARPDMEAKDGHNRYLWRMEVRRLDAEVVRDSILAVAGSLNREMGGPPVYPPVDPSLRADTFQGINWPEGEDSPKTWRRSVYIKVKRSLPFPQLEVFDCPDVSASVAKRNVTTTPIQALTLLNDPLVHRQAGMFAERIRKEAGADPVKQVERAYRLAVGRKPTAREQSLAVQFLKQQPENGLHDFCHAVLNLNEFVYTP
ncbi:MAG: PSD1 and planctomycete cytochrome C domain-containing protein [Armatimonadota bacterium]